MKYTIKESELKNLVKKHIVEALKQREKHSNEDRLKKFIKESVKKILREDAGNEYRGVFLPYGCDIKIWGPKIDICLDKKGLSVDEVQSAIDDSFGDDTF